MVASLTPLPTAPSDWPETHRLAQNAAMLIVDDEPGMRNVLKKSFDKTCGLVEVADSIAAAEALRRRYHFDVLVVDIRLPDGSGMEWLQTLRDQDVRTDVVVMTAYADLDTAIGALRAGAADFILKPFRLEQMAAAVGRCLERRRLARENFLMPRPAARTGLDGIVGSTEAMREVAELVRRVAPTSAMVLIGGETGTGKELVARAVHDLSGRSGPFVAVNCGSISPDLLESELFGHTKGAFTGAHSNREGLFSHAHGGTIFLDEIAEMPMPMQAKLLRVLEEKAVRPVGTDREVPVDARVITATNQNLDEQVAAGRFREDLFFRLNVVSIVVPPLRDRPEDIPTLATHFSNTLAEQISVPPVPFDHQAMIRLQSYNWPGNVRELRNVIERSLLLGKLPDDYFSVRAADHAGKQSHDLPLDWKLAEVEKHHMLRVLESVDGNKSQAARRLGVSRKTLERKLKAWHEDSVDDG